MLLIDRKMPKSCIDCVCNNDNYWCNMTGDELDCDIAWTGRMPNCPLKEEEIKTGKWARQETDLMCWYICSECGAKPLYDEYRTGRVFSAYCPNCGAKMEE